MKTTVLIAFASAAIGISSPIFAGSTYQATGPILELTDSKIVIQKDKEKWEIARTPATKVTGELKVGAKVTIHYTMTATAVEAKPTKPEPAAKPTPPAKAKPAK
jgi:acyl-coenzyme A synthetase/AMP-(fatty) acid ligase